MNKENNNRMISEEGYIFMGFGQKYVDECKMCAQMIEYFDSKRPKAILTRKEDVDYINQLEIFDDIVIIDFEKEERLKNEENKHNLYCVIPRILMPEYIPYNKTLAIDSDIACISNPERIWHCIKNRNQPFDCCGFEYEENWHWGQVNKINEKVGKKIPSIHGGVLLFNKDHEKFDQFHKDCIDALDNYDEYGCLRNFREGMTDEVIFSIAMAKNELLPMHYTQYPIVSFNLPPDIQIPCYYHTRNGFMKNTYVKCSDPIIFNHIFFHEGNNQNLYNWFLQFHKMITSDE